MELNSDILFYDSDCQLCINSARFLESHDLKHRFRLIPLNSPESHKYLQRENESNVRTQESVILIHNHNQFHKSDAIIRSLAALGGLWQLIKLLLIFPASIRDFFYDLVSRNRYKWFGKV